jgi:NADH:ubiquinone oxidoreductase subunit 3 (subunit A)
MKRNISYPIVISALIVIATVSLLTMIVMLQIARALAKNSEKRSKKKTQKEKGDCWKGPENVSFGKL